MIYAAVIKDFPESLRPRIKKIKKHFYYYRGTCAGFMCKCGSLIHDDFMSDRTLPEDTALVVALEQHVKTCKEVKP